MSLTTSSINHLQVNEATHNQVVDGQKGLWLASLLLEEANAFAGDLLSRHNDCIHVGAKHFGNSQLVFLMDWAAEIRQSPKLQQNRQMSNDRFLSDLTLISQQQRTSSSQVRAESTNAVTSGTANMATSRSTHCLLP